MEITSCLDRDILSHIVFAQSMVAQGSTYFPIRRLKALHDASLDICSHNELAILKVKVQRRIRQVLEGL